MQGWPRRSVIAIPPGIWKKAGIKQGSEVTFSVEDGKAIIKKVNTVIRL